MAIVMIAGLTLVAPTTTAVAAGDSSDAYERQTTTYTNTWRSVKDRVKLKESPCLDRYAESWARYLARNEGRWPGDLHHRSSSNLRAILAACNKRSIGENLAVGYPTGRATFNGWRSSPGHNANMLGSSYRWSAVGAYYSNGRWWVVQLVAR